MYVCCLYATVWLLVRFDPPCSEATPLGAGGSIVGCVVRAPIYTITHSLSSTQLQLSLFLDIGLGWYLGLPGRVDFDLASLWCD